jgi:sulfur transfer complex TusBCD TusB component (DsrH family)
VGVSILNIVSNAYRATFEEQDDTVVWFVHAMRAAGAEPDVLLRGNAVNYAVRDQDASGLRLGDWRQANPPRVAADVAALVAKGCRVFVLVEDLAARGIEPSELIDGLTQVSRRDAASLCAGYRHVWQW